MNFTYVTIRNYMNPKLLDKTRLYFGDTILISGIDKKMYGKTFLENLFIDKKIQNNYDYIILIDEDCLIYDEKYLIKIMNYMEENDIDIVGVPDGGEIPHRVHRPDVPNIFFCIIKTNKLKKFDTKEYKNYKVPCKESDNTKFNYDNFEQYYQILMYTINKLGLIFYPLHGKTILDELTTEVYFNNVPICLHTWYTREYDTNMKQRLRIDKAIEYGNNKYGYHIKK